MGWKKTCSYTLGFLTDRQDSDRSDNWWFFFSQKSSGTITLSLYRQHLRTQVRSSVKILAPSNFLFVFIIFLGRAHQWVGVESIMFSDGLLAARLSRVIISIWTFHFILTNGLRHSALGVQGKRRPFWNLIKESRIVFDNVTPSEFSVHWEALLLIFSVDVYYLHLVKCRAAILECSSQWSVWVLWYIELSCYWRPRFESIYIYIYI